MEWLLRWLKNILIALDQFLGVLFLRTEPDMTISAQAWLWHIQGKRSWPYRFINWLFWFQPNHCQDSYESERKGSHLPEELRK